jgi:cytochrome bd ubiquinol oxidase subunit II
MFETLSHLALQQYWWVLISILGGLLVAFLFVQGGQTLIYTVGKTEKERTMLVNSLGHKWELTFTTLVTFGGAMFAAFPLFYSTSFSGAYWVWMLILFCFVIQAVAYEYRTKPGNFLGQKTYEIFLIINGSIGVILLGAAVATFFTGSQFYIDELRHSEWKSSFHGIEAAFNPENLLLGLSVFFLARILALLYFISNIDDENIYKRVKRQLIINSLPFLLVFISFVVILLFKDGFAYCEHTRIVTLENNKYLHNFIQMPEVGVLFLAGVVLVLIGIYKGIFSLSKKGIWFSGIGTFVTVFALFCIAGLNKTCFYPSTFDLQSSLTIENASSSHYTLTAMSYVSLVIPVVIIYIFFVWKAMDKKQISATNIDEEETLY